MTLNDAKHEAEIRKKMLEDAIKQSVPIYNHHLKELVGAIDALVQARIKEHYHGDQ